MFQATLCSFHCVPSCGTWHGLSHSLRWYTVPTGSITSQVNFDPPRQGGAYNFVQLYTYPCSLDNYLIILWGEHLRSILWFLLCVLSWCSTMRKSFLFSLLIYLYQWGLRDSHFCLGIIMIYFHAQIVLYLASGIPFKAPSVLFDIPNHSLNTFWQDICSPSYIFPGLALKSAISPRSPG